MDEINPKVDEINPRWMRACRVLEEHPIAIANFFSRFMYAGRRCFKPQVL
jgi:hypothetical protein